MNIFKILANGHGTINENNVSAFLGYLLNPKADHSLEHSFLEKFLKPVISDEEDFNIYKYEYKVFFEQGIENIVDIVIVCYKDEIYGGAKSQMINFLTAKKSIHKIFLIENKITSNAVSTGQLQGQIDSTKKELEKLNIEGVEMYSIYATPDDDKCDVEFNSLVANNKTHIYWDNNDDENPNTSIRSILEGLLKDENNAKIETINTYTKDTIKSFIQFIDNGFKSEKAEEEVKKEETVPAYIRRITKELYAQNLISLKEIENLQSKKYSRDVFNINFEFIRQKGKSLSRSDNDPTSGYYTTKEIFENYYITTQLYNKNKDPFDKWVESLKKQISI